MNTRTQRRLLAIVLAATSLTSLALAHDDDSKRGKELFQPAVEYAADQANATPTSRQPLYEGLGTMTMAVTTKSKEAQTYFNQGWVLAWGFNHAEARRAFQEAQKLDPGFAMAYWGEAFVLGPNLNDGMHDDAIRPAYAAVQRAMELRDTVTPKERALIEALDQRYGANAMAQPATLNAAWAEKMKLVAAQFGNDANILTLYADALMNLQPWDYWEADGKTPKMNAAEIVAVLEQALKADPYHPGAAHLHIHAVEASATPERGEAVADRLRGKVPAVGHLVHMPSHLYIRLGRHEDSIAVNADAVKADEALFKAAGGKVSPLYRYGYYPHNVHFLLVSAQMAGVRDKVFEAAERLSTITSDELSAQLAWVQAIKTATYTAQAQFGDADSILDLKKPGVEFPFVQGFWNYARAVAYATQKDWKNARAEAEAIAELIAKSDFAALEAQYLPAKDVLAIAQNVAEARIAQGQKNYAKAEAHLRKAVEYEAAIAYMEPPYWYYPVKQSLGAVLLQQGRVEEAAETFRQALKHAPRNAWALWGLMQAERAMGDGNAKITEAAFEKAWLGDKEMLSLDRL